TNQSLSSSNCSYSASTVSIMSSMCLRSAFVTFGIAHPVIDSYCFLLSSLNHPSKKEQVNDQIVDASRTALPLALVPVDIGRDTVLMLHGVNPQDLLRINAKLVSKTIKVVKGVIFLVRVLFLPLLTCPHNLVVEHTFHKLRKFALSQSNPPV